MMSRGWEVGRVLMEAQWSAAQYGGSVCVFGWGVGGEWGWACLSAIPSALGWALNAALTPCWRRGHAASHLEPITLEGLWQSPQPTTPPPQHHRTTLYALLHWPTLLRPLLLLHSSTFHNTTLCFCQSLFPLLPLHWSGFRFDYNQLLKEEYRGVMVTSPCNHSVVVCHPLSIPTHFLIKALKLQKKYCFKERVSSV